MTTKEKEKAEALERLREMVKPGDKVFTILHHVSKSGMFRRIGLRAVGTHSDGSRCLLYLDGYASKVLGINFRKRPGTDYREDGLPVSGCGMDMGFSLVYDLGYHLYGDGYSLKQEWV